MNRAHGDSICGRSYSSYIALLTISVLVCVAPFVFAWHFEGTTPIQMLREIRSEWYRQQHPPLSAVVSSAVGFIGHSPIGANGSVVISSLALSRHPEMVRTFRRSYGYRRTPPHATPDIVFVIQPDKSVAGGVLRRYEYVSSTGELGHGDEWCVVPDEFRRWVLALRVKAAMLPPKARSKGRVISQSNGYHGFFVVCDPPNERIPDNARAEVRYALGRAPKGDTGWSVLRISDYHSMWHRWPASYAGKTITYRFRWKYSDGTYGPWSKPVSAKVLP